MIYKLPKKLKIKRAFFYPAVVLLMAGLIFCGYGQISAERQKVSQHQAELQSSQQLIEAINNYKSLKEQVQKAKELYPGIEINGVEDDLAALWQLILENKIEEAKQKFQQILADFQATEETEKQKMQLGGVLSYQNQAVSGAEIQIIKDGQVYLKLISGNDGSYTVRLFPAKYTVKVALSGYSEYSSEIEVVDKPVTLDIKLAKPQAVVSQPKTSAVASSNTNDGVYSKQTVHTERGDFTVYLLTIDLNQYRMVVDTASDGDCADNCPVLSVQEYVARNAGFAGIHGTYFCPTSYSGCAGQTNSFYFKLVNGKTGNRINWSNGLGDYLPFFKINDTQANYSDTWAAIKDASMSTGISCRPHLVENGQVVVTAADMDSDKESTYKISHGFLGHIGNTIYAGVVLSANLFDSAAVSQALGLTDSFNLDGGGTTAIFYNGSYKVGPGRAMPNAIVFIRR